MDIAYGAVGTSMAFTNGKLLRSPMHHRSQFAANKLTSPYLDAMDALSTLPVQNAISHT